MKVKTQKSALPGAWIVNPIDKGANFGWYVGM